MGGVQIDVKLSGPLFQPGVRAKVEGAINDAIGDLVVEGERQVKLQLYPGHGLDSGFYARSIHGEVVASMHGVVNDSNVVYGPWLEEGGGRFRGYAMFRKAMEQMNRIAKGLLQKRVGQLVIRLN